ncbi:unnamed protein product [Candidula unifasciata]|uniref:Uncharacterized protein n=1 Tax=Candidula unifasciata TaxID=100452 RepID=A0A8S4A4P1_9EUPU|nr:unnamed protein product [Candidula unifasciata]
MSSSGSVFTAHSSFKQQNGDVSSGRSVRATMESIKSVHENPFYKNFGIKHSAPPYPRQANKPVVSEDTKRVSTNGRSSVDDDIGEYRPGSGYVHKLLDKFSSLTVREEPIIPAPHLKRSSSLDELPGENETVKDSVVVSRTIGLRYEKLSYLSVAKLSHRTRSIEELNHTHQKYHRGSAVSHQHSDTQWGMDKQLFTHKFQRDIQTVPADGDQARDEIIMNDSVNSGVLLENTDDNERYSDTTTALNSHESVLQAELPKPNTVLTVRNIFESASSASVLHSRRQRSDSPSFVSVQSVKPVLSPLQASHVSASSQESALNRVISHSSSPLASPKHTSDTLAKPSSSLSKIENARHVPDSDLPSRSNVQKSVAAISSNSGMSIVRPQTSSSPYRTNANPTSPSAFSPVSSADGRLFRFDGENSLETSETFHSLHHTSSYNAPSLLATVTGVQLHSSAISDNQKSSLAVSSSSFKDRIEDGKHYEHPVMIFAKANLSPQKNRPHRVRDYTPLNDEVDGINEVAEQLRDAIRSAEAKAQFDANDYSHLGLETTNKVSSQRRIFESNSNISDKNTNNQSKPVPIRNQIIKEAKNSQKHVLDNDKSNSENKSKNIAAAEVSNSVDIKRSNVRKPIVKELLASLETQPAPLVSNFKDRKKRVTFSVSSTAQEDDDAKPTSHLSNSITAGHELLSDAYKDAVDSDQSHSDESPALNDQPLSHVNKNDSDPKELPVKGIPSIVAQRLKKHNFDPSQVAEDVLSSSDATEQHLQEASRKNLDSASGNPTSSDSENDSLATEIENEISNVRRKMEESRNKSTGLLPIFDSSQLSKKRRERKKQQASAGEEVVPALDLSGMTDDQAMEYQLRHKKIAPCNIIFIGENADTSRSLLTKQRKVKINIHFNDAKTETFEYPNEATALEHYLEDHPHEKDEILVLEDFTGGGNESSDEVQIDVYETPVTPRGSADDDLLKSNTSLAHAGSLQSYRGRFQQDYQLGSVQVEEPKKPVEPEPVVDPDKLMLRPAEEDDTNTWSTSSSSDILF